MRRRTAFTLTEVVIALGIIAFVIVALLGLVSVSLDRTRESKRDTFFTNMAQQVLRVVRTASWGTALDAATGRSYDFDADGNPLFDSTGQPSEDSGGTEFYTCSIRPLPLADFGASVPDPNVLSYLNGYSLRIAWPAGAPPANQTELTLPFSVARYEY